MPRTDFMMPPERVKAALEQIGKRGDAAAILEDRIETYRKLVPMDVALVEARLEAFGLPPLSAEDPEDAVHELEDRKGGLDPRTHAAVSLLRSDVSVLLHAEQMLKALRQD